MAQKLGLQSLQSDPSRVLQALEAGACVVIPTETVYGLAADATKGDAVAKIFELKNRPKFNPLICHVSDLDMAQEYGVFNETARQLCKAFWPGPLTLVVPSKPDNQIHDLVSADLETIALRCPRGIAREVIRQFGKPLAAPSANRSGRVSPTNADHVMDEFSNEDLIVVDGGPCQVGLESTIVAVTKEGLVILRPGSVTEDDMKQIVNVKISVHSDGTEVLAPGMMRSHYAPDAAVRLNCDCAADGEILLGFGPVKGAINLSPQGDMTEAAANLYSYLKQLDEQQPATICVAPIPGEGLGVAINDRLKRAAAPRG